jgi:hypothetical protein
MENFNTGRFSKVADAVKSIMSREGDFSATKRLQYFEVAKEVYESLNLAVIKDTKRVVIKLNPHLPVLPLPDDFFDFATLDYVDRDGSFKPLVFNDKLKDDVVDVSLDHDCGCECGCKYSLCSAIKDYETITEQVTMDLPNNTPKTFTKYTRKYVNPDGSFFQEIGEPVRVYDNGTWTDTRMEVTQSFICKLEVKECGCLVECEHNRTQLEANCCGISFTHECGCSHPEYYKERKTTYNISQDGNRLILPEKFLWDKIVLRYYATIKTKDILIPRLGLKAFMTGLKKELVLWDKKASDREVAKWENEHSRAVVVFRRNINRMTLKDFYEYYYGRKLVAYRGQSHLDDQYYEHGHFNNDF